MSVRVLVIDDHTLFRSGLSELLERRGIEVVGAVGSGDEGCALALEVEADVILLDLRMPVEDGLSVLQRMKADGVAAPVVMLTTSNNERDLLISLRAGAQGYLLKDMEPEQLIRSLHDVLAGATIVSPEMTGVLAKVVQGEEALEDRDRFSELTPREKEILCHLADGMSNKKIAAELGITDGTVKLHVRSILKKLDVRSRVEAAVLAVQENFCK